MLECVLKLLVVCGLQADPRWDRPVPERAPWGMGLDGGTYVTRSDVLRGQSWAMAQADASRSTRGGSVGRADIYKKRRLEPRNERCGVGATGNG